MAAGESGTRNSLGSWQVFGLLAAVSGKATSPVKKIVCLDVAPQQWRERVFSSSEL